MINLQATTNLKNHLIDFDHWSDFHDDCYSIYNYKDKPCGLHFRCPGCKQIIAIDTGTREDDQGNIIPAWTIDFTSLTATPSILHMKEGKGCGWHGYLTKGELKPC